MRRVFSLIGGLALAAVTGLALAAAPEPAASPATAAAPPSGRACAGRCFQMNAVSIEGATVYKAGALAPT